MSSYGLTCLEGRDTSVELYLLNHWVRDFSLRDLIDRVSVSSTEDERIFLPLFRWLMSTRLSANTEEKWSIEDFRKLALLLSKNVRSEEVTDFMEQAVD